MIAADCWHHVTQRGNLGPPVFFDDDDQRMYLNLLRAQCRRTGLQIAGYCLMTNHAHLIAVPPDARALAAALGRTHGDYARWVHLKRAETGHLWQNRYYSCPLDERHQWEALRYVEMNPVRAGLAVAAEDWPWSSARAHTGGVDGAGLPEAAAWRKRWLPAEWRETLAEGVANAALLQRIREATRTGRPAADEAFIAELERIERRALRPMKRGPKTRPAIDERQLQLEVG